MSILFDGVGLCIYIAGFPNDFQWEAVWKRDEDVIANLPYQEMPESAKP